MATAERPGPARSGPAAGLTSDRIAGTYRVQVNAEFDLDAAASVVDYVAALGATELYTAPLLAAVPGSTHGYDVVDHSATNPRIGGEQARLRLVAALRQAGLGLVVDIVPNHAGVAVPAANRAWWDVLRLGQQSRYADWFDIDWSRGRLLLPVLGDDPGALDDLKILDGELHYYESRFPIAPGTGDGSPREVHDRQAYELVNWRRGDTELNYRRFFTVTGLAGLRVEDPAVFDATHAEILRWYTEGRAGGAGSASAGAPAVAGGLRGIRVDHPDGLLDPGGYLARLRAAAPDAWLVVEKILEPGEELPHWPVDGTTGYDALNEICGLFVDPAAEPALDAFYQRFTGDLSSWAEAALTGKREAAERMLAAERNRLARLTPSVPDAAAALGELAAHFPVYRSYLPDGVGHLTDALVAARAARPDLAGVLDALAPRLTDPGDELARRFQQLSGAVMAKGVEDTGYYRWSRFAARNEVGGDPGTLAVRPGEFHRAAAYRQGHWPASMTTLSTHDTKRAEDVRARLAVLAENPDDWGDAVTGWAAANPLPEPRLAYLLWQAVVGAWPLSRERLWGYAEKAAREAGTATSWVRPDRGFETALGGWVDRIFDDAALHASISAFVESIAADGRSNGLGQKLVQLTAPGIPDTYQGTELWDHSLVDPDNRRPVDYAARRDLLARLDDGWLPPVDPGGAAKLLVTARALRLRRDRPELFGSYAEVAAAGPAAAHAVAFDRGGALTVATRLPVGLRALGGWGETTLELPAARWRDALTDRPVGSDLFADLLDTYPVALLVAS